MTRASEDQSTCGVGGGAARFGLWPLWRRFAGHLRACPGLVALTLALVLLAPLVGGAILWLLKLVVDEVLVAGRLDLVLPLAGLYGALAALQAAIDYAQTRLEATTVERLARDIRVALYGHLLKLSPGSLRERSAGDLISHLSGDVHRTQALIYSSLVSILDDLASAAFYLVLLLALSWKLTLVALIVVPLLTFAALHYAPRLRRAHRVTRRRESAWMSLAERTLNAVPAVQAFGAERQETGEFARASDRARESELHAVSLQASQSFVIEMAAALGTVAIFVVGARELAAGALTLGTLAAFIGSLGYLYGPIRGLAKTSARLQRAAAGAQRLAVLFDAESRVRDRPGAVPMARPRGAIEFRGVSFSYRAGAEVLSGIDLRIAPGETVALVGPSGGGKSTLVQLLIRLHDPDSGAVLVDGRDLRTVTLASLRSSIAVVFQDPHLLRGSAAANIRYGRPEASDAEMIAAARAAHADGFLATARGGYERRLGTRGEGLSGGQRQRVAFARALLRDAPILVLDEATSSVDGETEMLMQETVERLAGRRTIVIVAHRLASIRRADRVVVVEQGRIVEIGPPEQLLHRPSRCRALFASQLQPARAA